MAGDWIKVECVTPSKPEVYKIADQCDIEPEHAFGSLLCIWIWADQHTEDGNAVSVTKKLIDRVSGVTGFADAMQGVGWLHIDEGGATFPNFGRHNGKTAKNRALTAKRVSEHKQKSNAKGNAELTQGALPREEKRREENKNLKTLSDKSPSGGGGEGENDDSGYKELAKASKPKKSKYSFSTDHHQLAVWMSCPVKRRFPTQDVDLDKWADTVRKLMEIDGYTQKQIEWLWRAITTDERQGFSWSQNCRTPMKLREKKDGLSYFEIIKNQFAGGQRNASNQPGRDSAAAPKRQSLIERTNAQARAIIAECEAEEASGGIVGSYD